jgi:hypothetical protein
VGKVRVDKSRCQLDLSLTTDVVKDDIVAILDAAHWLPVIAYPDQWLQCLVFLACVVRSAYCVSHRIFAHFDLFPP